MSLLRGGRVTVQWVSVLSCGSQSIREETPASLGTHGVRYSHSSDRGREIRLRVRPHGSPDADELFSDL
ncbi:hypothetical protein BaRGS_00014866 [Batillaria attramentaria]|uniref:Uncharacterized protein n=1 Tax=Batillaria attramentaria TaxID=370345 RepID=A0ABD0L3K7_9CAEN